MKAILNLSITCMVAAGLYGFADFASDLNDGNLIRYDEGNNAAKLKVVSNSKRNKLELPLDKKKKEAATSENPSEETSIDPDRLQMKYFSRGMPVVEEDEIIEDSTQSTAAVESAQGAETSTDPH